MHDFAVDRDAALEPFVLALDVGSTASRGGLYDAAGRPVKGRRDKVAHQFTTAADGTSVIDADQVVAELEQIITEVVSEEAPGVVRGVAIDTFSSSLVGVDGAGRALTPCFTYADSRNADQARELRAELDEAEMQQRTGCRIHTSYLPARLRWLRATDAKTFGRVAQWQSLGEYLHLRLLGSTAVGTSAAAWTGLLDRHTAVWDPAMLRAAGIAADQLSPIHHPDQPLPGRTDRWDALADAAWFAVVADGYAANIGAGAEDPRTMVASVATTGAMRVRVPADFAKLPAGLWCYRVDAGHSLLGGALNDVGRAVSWLESTLRLDDVDLDDLLTADPDPDTPVVLPYLTGERSTGWAAGARAVLAGVSTATSAAALARATMEGVALTYGRVAGAMGEVAGAPDRILASGRVSQDLPDLLQVFADVLGAPVTPVTIKRSTLHGTALLALETVAPGVARAAPTTAATREPVAGRADYYADRATRYTELYEAVIAGS